MVRTKDDILSILAREKPALKKRFGVRQLALFGSYACGDANEKSDVDILVDVDPAIGLDFVTLADHLETMLGLPVELISKRAVKPRNWEVLDRELVDVA
jgi:predicted nucleotidyltransferase